MRRDDGRTALIDGFFEFRRRGTDLATELRAGLTTFMVMAYIIFVNPIVLGYSGVPGLEGKGLPFAATLTVTCLTAGLLSIRGSFAVDWDDILPPGPEDVWRADLAAVAQQLAAHDGRAVALDD